MGIDELRKEVNDIDDRIATEFVRRMEVSGEIAEYKKAHGLPVLDRTRERDILARVSAGMDAQTAGYARVLFSTLFSLSRSRQSLLLDYRSTLPAEIEAALDGAKEFPEGAMVACQGTEGAYSQLACDRIFKNPQIMYFSSFRSVIQAVDKKMCRYGILPIENSIYGSVGEVYDLMKEYRFRIVRSARLQIRHSLLANAGASLEGIKEIVSHSQALGQCSDFIASLGNVKVTVCENTAVAARTVAESGRKDIAAISSENCASLYGLYALRSDIQNIDHNYTRFICISRDTEIYPGANRMSIMFSLSHSPGSLAEFISRVSALGLNILKLESRPIPGRDFEFMFYMDIDAQVSSPAVLSLIAELDASPEFFAFLGSYSEI